MRRACARTTRHVRTHVDDVPDGESSRNGTAPREYSPWGSKQDVFHQQRHGSCGDCRDGGVHVYGAKRNHSAPSRVFRTEYSHDEYDRASRLAPASVDDARDQTRDVTVPVSLSLQVAVRPFVHRQVRRRSRRRNPDHDKRKAGGVFCRNSTRNWRIHRAPPRVFPEGSRDHPVLWRFVHL